MKSIEQKLFLKKTGRYKVFYTKELLREEHSWKLSTWNCGKELNILETALEKKKKKKRLILSPLTVTRFVSSKYITIIAPVKLGETIGYCKIFIVNKIYPSRL